MTDPNPRRPTLLTHEQVERELDYALRDDGLEPRRPLPPPTNRERLAVAWGRWCRTVALMLAWAAVVLLAYLLFQGIFR